MPILGNDTVTIGKLLIVQWLTLLIISALFTVKNMDWAIAAFFGGLVILLPNVLFAWLTHVKVSQEPRLGTPAFTFLFAWVVKLMASVVLLMLVIYSFKDQIIPLGLAFIAMLLVHLVAPLVIDSFRNNIKSTKG